MAFHTTDRSSELLPVDEHIAPLEMPYEVLDGKLVRVSPSNPAHARRQSKISALLEAHVARRFQVASDMLTRTSATNDFAPDVSVFPRGRDPQTGGRHLEHMAFEVVSSQTMAFVGRRAAKLARRGVRRVFAIQTKRDRALEWSRRRRRWEPLDPTSYIEDPSLAVPLPVAALLTAAEGDDEIARALILKGNRVIEASLAKGKAKGRAEGRAKGRAEGRAKGRAEGKAEGLADALLATLAARGVRVAKAARARIRGERDVARLLAWISRASTCESVRELFAARRARRPGQPRSR
jgi:Uma2 family endonuclease